ncbi:hypothetical protein SCATT_43540 [Streptantibioticus cattleyicolor NRRL 8057 = DSM 46488]|uniref:Uncharacterized protein n=1 Tax=Streptantibioticus cattleyicolor (strain ATCC 35852 / DSM 46488 / JCM 4925 / NBRC 14057 / NRRL 8057) TaxID=1003195 RepID=G8WUW1_STREN|nr:hypothetical protein SCATT_43540 [Streptantibioticus cattleyicolor NRRL 8057 = DSM 46488]
MEETGRPDGGTPPRRPGTGRVRRTVVRMVQTSPRSAQHVRPCAVGRLWRPSMKSPRTV